MTALYIILGIIAFIILLLSIKVMITVHYDEELTVSLSWLFLKFDLLPMTEKHPKKEKKNMAQLDEIRSIIMNMKAQSRAQAQGEVYPTEGSAALAIEQPAVKVAEPIQLIRGGRMENSRSEKPNTQNLRGQYGDTDPLQKQEKCQQSE